MHPRDAVAAIGEVGDALALASYSSVDYRTGELWDLRAITEAACLYFTTVLDPGSDAAHQNHLHLDVKERRGGYRYCW